MSKGIVLAENFPESFSFNNNFSLLKFEYYFAHIDGDINIIFNLLNKDVYTIRILIEDIGK